VPIDNRVDTHKLRPALVRGVKVCKKLSVRVSPPGPQKYGLDCWGVFQVCLKSRSHGKRITFEVEIVLFCGLRNEIFDFRKRIG
jgi:hypothetical protein